MKICVRSYLERPSEREKRTGVGIEGSPSLLAEFAACLLAPLTRYLASSHTPISRH